MPFKPLILITTMILSGCSFQADINDTTGEYSQRLASVLDHPGAELADMPPLPVPPKQQTSKDTLQISIKDFYQLRDCSLYSLVAERNTALGKIQAPSQRYIYELKLLQALQSCLNSTQDAALKQQLRHWQQQKQTALNLQWQRLLESEEIRHALGRNSGWVQSKQTDRLSETRQSLQYLLSLSPESAQPHHSGELEQHLQQLQQARLMARVFRTQRMLQLHLSALTQWLHARDIQCPDGKALEQVKYLRNVFGLFFVKQIQPLASRTNDIYYQLMPLWQSLLQAHPPMSDWLDQRQTEFEHYRHSLSEHIRFWQVLFEKCNLSPPANQP
ncbi:DUF3080 family protein [Lacimicrobium alkaliphilum]|uniref:DUF3080 domain-containing protein n=1 Tax=Lacimicrobium alkaliphilum TaxID=1526571 RepID=A0A0U3AZU7_9ALTE|nr:DUF3080 family protein [Lacimicrobium alkaliphilum]ALS98400.1 hypothetical protein AT746_09115 [Lacimicrobium alkaliphilum]